MIEPTATFSLLYIPDWFGFYSIDCCDPNTKLFG